MYLEYETSQLTKSQTKYAIRSKKPPKRVPFYLPRPSFMPTKLVRVSDMSVVDSHCVNEGYCALSYSWNQSGTVKYLHCNKYIRIDEGKHRITRIQTLNEPQTKYNSLHGLISGAGKSDKNQDDFSLRILNRRRPLRRGTRRKLMGVTDYEFLEHEYVKFEGVIQQICKQFNVKYIWYDQMCINQNNKEEKRHEIRNMHRIYSNAYCTIAIVPEFQLQDYTYNSGTYEEIVHAENNLQSHQYFKRLWTLEEAIKSHRILFIGNNIHCWGEDLTYQSNINIFNKPLSQFSVPIILYYAHQRTSSKEHDRVFALLNLFPDIIDKIDIDYDQPFNELMIQFYGLLAKRDIKILDFKKISNGYKSTIQNYEFLPSWTGVDGEHDPSISAGTIYKSYNIVGKTMHLTSSYITNKHFTRDKNIFTLQFNDLLSIPDDANRNHKSAYCYLCISVQLSGASATKTIQLVHYKLEKDILSYKESLSRISKKLQQLSRFMDIKKENMFFYYRNEEGDIPDTAFIDFSYLTDGVDDPLAQYVLLSDIQIEKEYYDNLFYPVIKKRHGEKYFKAIGCCQVRNNHGSFFSECSLPKQTFLIQ